MRKGLKRSLFIISIVIAMLFIWMGQRRSFYCLGKNRCITLWKTYNNNCYIIPGKYYGVIKPSGNYIKATNVNPRFGNNYFTFFFTDELPNTLIFNSEGEFEINNQNKGKILFLDYSKNVKKCDKILYMPNAKETNALKENANFILLDTKENYAVDKTGKKL